MSIDELYSSVHVPLPSRPIAVDKDAQTPEILSAIDDCFRDVIRDYPQDIKTKLEAMYFNNANVHYVDKLYNRKGAGIAVAWKYEDDTLSNETTHRSTRGHFSQLAVVIDSAFKDSPVFVAMSKVHEIGCHIGQLLHLQQTGYHDELLHNHGAVNGLMELSAALVDKPLYDAIPRRVFDNDLGISAVNAMMSGDSEACFLLTQYQDTIINECKPMRAENFWRLKHREGKVGIDGTDSNKLRPDNITEKNFNDLHKRPDVRTYTTAQSRLAPEVDGSDYISSKRPRPTRRVLTPSPL